VDPGGGVRRGAGVAGSLIRKRFRPGSASPRRRERESVAERRGCRRGESCFVPSGAVACTGTASVADSRNSPWFIADRPLRGFAGMRLSLAEFVSGGRALLSVTRGSAADWRAGGGDFSTAWQPGSEAAARPQRSSSISRSALRTRGAAVGGVRSRSSARDRGAGSGARWARIRSRRSSSEFAGKGRSRGRTCS